MCLINENRNEGFVGKSKMWKVKVSLTAAKWHLQSFVLMKLGGNRPKRVSNKTYFCQLLELVWSWQMPNFYRKKTWDLEKFCSLLKADKHAVSQGYVFQETCICPNYKNVFVPILGLQWGWCSEGGFCQVTEQRRRRERGDFKSEKRSRIIL